MHWTIARICEAQSYARSKGTLGFAANQMLWSLAVADLGKGADPTLVGMDEEMKAYHVETGLAAIPYTSQANGLFTKWASGVFSFDDERIKPWYRSQHNVERYHRANRLAAELQLDVGQIVLAYLTSHPFPAIPIIGCRTIAQLEDSVKAQGVTLTLHQIHKLEQG